MDAVIHIKIMYAFLITYFDFISTYGDILAVKFARNFLYVPENFYVYRKEKINIQEILFHVQIFLANTENPCTYKKFLYMWKRIDLYKLFLCVQKISGRKSYQKILYVQEISTYV